MSQKTAKEKRKSEGPSTQRKALKKYGVAIIVVLAVVGLIAGIVMTRETASSITDKTPDPTAGKADATVVVRTYEDFQCPACAGVQPVVEDLIKEYGDRVKFIFNDFPLPQHKNATTAAVAAQCVFDQGKYVEYASVLFSKQTEWELLSTEKAQDKLRGYAQDLGVDVDKFNECVADPATADRVTEDLEEGRGLGVNSTPSFFVGDKKITETPFSTSLKNEIDAALKAAQ